METGSKSALDRALFDAQKKMGVLVKDAHNDFSNFNYTKAESVIRESKRILHEHGLFVTGGMETAHEVAGKPYIHTVYVLRHPESGEREPYSRDWPVCPSKGQNEVRAAAVTNTSGFSYFLRDLLMIERAEADDLNARNNDNMPSEADDLADRCIAKLDSLPTGWASEKKKTVVDLRRVVDALRTKGAENDLRTMLGQLNKELDKVLGEVPF